MRLKSFNFPNINQNRFFLGVLVSATVLGTLSGYLMVKHKPVSNSPSTNHTNIVSQDIKTFRDFAEGTIQKRPASKDPGEYVEGTHLLVREGAVPVALTSSVVDLNQYEGKKVKVLGETQKAIKEGWLMDVGKVEVK